MVSPIDKLALYIATKIMKTIRIKFPKNVLNKLTKNWTQDKIKIILRPYLWNI